MLDFAYAESERRRTAVHAVHVWDEPWNLAYLRHTAGLGQDVVLIEKQLRLRLDGLLQGAAGRHPGVDPVGRIEAGSAGRTLIQLTRSADLMVVGARRAGSGQRHRQWIGPVVNTLLHRAECPVAVVPCGPTPQ